MQEELVKRARKGDRDAFCQLVDPLEKKLYHYARFLCPRKEDAEDILQEALLRAFQNLAQLRNPNAFTTYMYRIVRNTFYDLTRKKEGSLPAENPPLPDPQDEFEKQELAQKVHRALARLEPEFREPLLLYIWEELRYEEIAEVLEVEVGTVKSRLSRAKAKLLKIWSEME